jgi:hypothetical protein
MSLSSYVAANPSARGRACWACGIPQRAEIDAARRAGSASVTQMVGYLRAAGHAAASRGKLESHFEGGHHVQAPAPATRAKRTSR